ncbi:hypothetical protein SAMN05216175_102149 [Neptunomonas qingdaonensis]|uniref:Uncharacterized protein n=2 Tax=Neptunomonas qingdaonensis TaxID=1045558 RepID=A0A1I2N2N0_9GAMM|nr:hypothetical protein SAMN05216175_102149 [Neptunomonas qingdaonensis]
MANLKLGKQRGVPIERILIPKGSISIDRITLKVPAVPIASSKKNSEQEASHDLLIDSSLCKHLRKLQQDEIDRTGGFTFGPRRSPPHIRFSTSPALPVERVVQLSYSEDAMQRQTLVKHLRRWLSKGNNQALSRLGGDQRQDLHGSGYFDWEADGFLGLGWS